MPKGRGKRKGQGKVRNVKFQDNRPTFLKKMYDANPEEGGEHVDNPLYMGTQFDNNTHRERKWREKREKREKDGSEVNEDGTRKDRDYEKPVITNLDEFLQDSRISAEDKNNLKGLVRQEQVSTLDSAKVIRPLQTKEDGPKKQFVHEISTKNKKFNIKFTSRGKKRKAELGMARKKKKKKKKSLSLLSFADEDEE